MPRLPIVTVVAAGVAFGLALVTSPAYAAKEKEAQELDCENPCVEESELSVELQNLLDVLRARAFGGPKTVFVTHDRFSGDLGGLAGADAKCQDAASGFDIASSSGVFRAWLSDETTDARDRITPSAGPYVLVDGLTVVADDFDDLITGDLLAPIDQAADGFVVPPFDGSVFSHVWTSTGNDGTLLSTDSNVVGAVGAPFTCDNWESASASETGETGDATTLDAWTLADEVPPLIGWTDGKGAQACNDIMRLYCFEL
jgi:hypothetical protein